MNVMNVSSSRGSEGRVQGPKAIRIVRTMTFSSAHRYFNPSLSDEANRKLYGSWYREKGFGHDFLLEAHFEGSVDPLTGMIVNLVDIDRWLGALKKKLDHYHLNELEAFKGVSPTPERIAQFCCQEIARQMVGQTPARLHKVRLYEGDHLWIDCYE